MNNHSPRSLLAVAIAVLLLTASPSLVTPLEAQSPSVRAKAEVAALLARTDVKTALDLLDARSDSMASGLASLAAIESPSGGEQKRAAEVARRMRSIGLSDVKVDSMPNVTGRIPGRSGRSVVFVATLDDLASIPALQRAAPRPPYVAGNRVVGPGTNTSATTEAMLAAAQALVSMNFKPEHDLIFAAVAQEETGLLGMKSLYRQSNPRTTTFVDILGDGSSITYGALGIDWWRVMARGPAGHSLNGGLPNVNQAIARAVDRIFSLPQPPQADNPTRTILNIAVLRSGELFNHKPDSGWFSLDIRSLDAKRIASNETAVRAILREVASETGIKLEMIPVQLTPGGQIAGADTSRLVLMSAEIARSIGLSPTLGNAGSANMNVPIAGGTPAIGIGGERGGERGNPGEFADIPSMLRTAKHVFLLGLTLGESNNSPQRPQ